MTEHRKEYMRVYQNAWIKARREDWLQANGPCNKCGSYNRLEVDHIIPRHLTGDISPARIWGYLKRREILN